MTIRKQLLYYAERNQLLRCFFGCDANKLVIIMRKEIKIVENVSG